MLLTVVIICEVSMMLQAMLQNMPSWQNWCSVTPTFLYIIKLATNNGHIFCPFLIRQARLVKHQQTFQNGTSSTKATSRVCVRRGPGSMERGGGGGGYIPSYGAGGFLHNNNGASYRDPGPRLDRSGASHERDKQKFQSGYLHILVEPVNFTHFPPRMVLILAVVGKRKVLCLC